MSPRFCIGCGAPLPTGAQFCESCGRPVTDGGPASPTAVAPPVPPMASSAPLSSGSMDWPPSSPPKPKRSPLVIIGVIVIVILLIVGSVAVYLVYFAPPTVSVDAINVWAPDNTCGLGSNLIGYNGLNASPGSSQELELPVPNYNNTSCAIVGVVTNSSGFSVTQAALPLTVPASPSSSLGSVSANLDLTLKLPGSGFSGVVNLVFR